MTPIQEVDAEAFRQSVQFGKPCVVLFWLRSCDQCRLFKPVYEQLAKAVPAAYYSLNMLKSIPNLQYAEGLGVEETPTVKVFCGGREAGGFSGYKSLSEAESLLRGIIISCR